MVLRKWLRNLSLDGEAPDVREVRVFQQSIPTVPDHRPKIRILFSTMTYFKIKYLTLGAGALFPSTIHPFDMNT